MPEMYQTETGVREDLAEILGANRYQGANPEIGYIGGLIYPEIAVSEKVGDIYYQTLQADSTAQTGRTLGTAPTAEILTNSTTAFTCAEKIDRTEVTEDEVKTMGGIERADSKGSQVAFRNVMNAREEEIADAILTNASATVDDIEASFLGAAAAGINAVRRYYGRTFLVCSYTVAKRLTRYTEVVNRIQNTAGLNNTQALQLVGGSAEILAMVLRGVLDIEGVLVGDDAQWFTSDAAKQDRAAIVKVPPAEDLVYKDGPIVGVNLQFMPTESSPVEVRAFWDDDDLTNKYTVQSWNKLLTLNTGAIYILDGIDEANAVTTTSTTTT